jgi:hypothetical protein
MDIIPGSDPHLSEKPDPDPQNLNTDPKQWFLSMIFWVATVPVKKYPANPTGILSRLKVPVHGYSTMAGFGIFLYIFLWPVYGTCTLYSTDLSCCVLIKHLLRADIRMLLFITGIFLLGPAISPALQPIPNKQQTTLQSKRRLDQIMMSILISFADSVIRYRYEPDV